MATNGMGVGGARVCEGSWYKLVLGCISKATQENPSQDRILKLFYLVCQQLCSSKVCVFMCWWFERKCQNDYIHIVNLYNKEKLQVFMQRTLRVVLNIVFQNKIDVGISFLWSRWNLSLSFKQRKCSLMCLIKSLQSFHWACLCLNL